MKNRRMPLVLLVVFIMLCAFAGVAHAGRNFACSSDVTDKYSQGSSFYEIQPDIEFAQFYWWLDDFHQRGFGENGSYNENPAPVLQYYYARYKFNGVDTETVETVSNSVSLGSLFRLDDERLIFIADGFRVECPATTGRFARRKQAELYQDPFGFSFKDGFDRWWVNAQCFLERTDGLKIGGQGYYEDGSWEQHWRDTQNPLTCNAGGGKG